MTVDIEKLEALAKAVRDDPSDWQPTQAAWEYHQALKDPGVVLELIAELKCPMRLARHSKRLIEDLRAELAGLKTGYEAYERVNAELRAECEALRKDAQRYRWIENPFAGLFGVESLNKYIDAAMSKEQSHD
ncbi:hypothetical protein [Pseudomonas syringae]|uniref:hypothetical protein n=1 Tax=Pseudomonas syringae TaxID=317 RepID=UPI0032D99B9A